MKRASIIFILPVFLIVFQFCNMSADKISQWRGPDRDGIYPEKELLQEWPEDGPELLWKFDKLGIGYTSVAATSDKIYATGITDSIGYIYAFDNDGNTLWKKDYGPEWTVNFPGTRTSPLIYNEYGYLLTGYGKLFCFNTNDGSIVWSKNILEEYDGENPPQGITENLVMDGNTLFCTPGGKEKNVVALNRMTGEELWSSKGNSEISAFCSPKLIVHNEKKFFITMTDSTIFSVDVENGNVAWKISELIYRFPDHPNTPIYKDGYLLYMDGGKGGSVMLKLSDDGYSFEKVWASEILDMVIGNSVVLDGKIYSASTKEKAWVCVDWKTGEKLYSSDAIPGGSIISADGLLFCHSFKGEFGLFKPTETGFELKGLFKVDGKKSDHWAHPVIKDGRLYVRYHDSLLVYKIK